MRIQNNMMALNTYRQYNIANNATANYAEKLSSGYQINRAGDDAAGLAISEKMRAQIRGLNMASKNSLDAVSLIQTAEGALQSTHDILQRMRELAVQSASDTNETIIDRGALDKEYQALMDEIDDTARTTRFNDQNLIDGTFQKAFYSTNVTQSQLTTGTTANVSRVGVKSNYNQNGTYEIGVKYIEAKEVQYATASAVSVSGTKGIVTYDANQAPTSYIKEASFEAVDGAAHNGKTFEIRASGSGSDLLTGTSGGQALRVELYDSETGATHVGTIKTTNRSMGVNEKTGEGATITVNFEGIGELTLDLRDDQAFQDIDKTKLDSYNISSMLDGKQIKFLKSPVIVTDDAAALPVSKAVNVPKAIDLAATYADFSGITGFTPDAGLTTYTPFSAADIASLANITVASGAVVAGGATLGGTTINTTSVEFYDAVSGGGSTTTTAGSIASAKLTIAGIGTFVFDIDDGGGSGFPQVQTNIRTILDQFAQDYNAAAVNALGTTYTAGTNATAFADDGSQDGSVANSGNIVIDTAGNYVMDASSSLKLTLADGTTDFALNSITITDGASGAITTANVATSAGKAVLDFGGLGTFTVQWGAGAVSNATDLQTLLENAINSVSIDLAVSPAQSTVSIPIGTSFKMDNAIDPALMGQKLSITGGVAPTGGVSAGDPATTPITAADLDFSGVTVDIGGTAQTIDTASITITNGDPLVTNPTAEDQIQISFTVTGVGDFTIGLAAKAGRDVDALMTELNAALTSFTKDLAHTTYLDPAVKVDVATGDAYEKSILTVDTGTGVIVGANGSITGATLSLTVVNKDDTAETLNTFSVANGNMSFSMKQIGGGDTFDANQAQQLTINLDGYGVFTVDIPKNATGAAPRTAADLTTALNAALADTKIVLNQVHEGKDTVAATEAEIALSLNGEVVTLQQNNKVAMFEYSGVCLNFDALDMDTVFSDASATAKFTTSTNKPNTIQVYVDESAGRNLIIQTGANQGDELAINIDAMDTNMLGLTGTNLKSQKAASEAITRVNNAINQVSTQRAALGALQNRLNFKIANLDTSAENLQAAESRIRDTDMAKTMTAFTKSNILGQAATAMLAQANSQPQNVLQLLR